MVFCKSFPADLKEAAMADKKPPPPRQPSFSRRFDKALVTTRLTESMVEADGWHLDQFTEAPPWLKQLYNRHAEAARKEINDIDKMENSLRPSEHD